MIDKIYCVLANLDKEVLILSAHIDEGVAKSIVDELNDVDDSSIFTLGKNGKLQSKTYWYQEVPLD